MSTRSEGEEVFAQTFQFATFVPQDDHDLLRDFLYKFAHNYSEAAEFLRILEQVDAIDFDSKSELLLRIQAMAIQCFPLAMRRITDAASKRSAQRLVNQVYKEAFKTEEIEKVKSVHSHYKFYLDKGVAHQDEISIKEMLEKFPDTDTIKADMKYLSNLYKKIVTELCTKYINIDKETHDYYAELRKLVIS